MESAECSLPESRGCSIFVRVRWRIQKIKRQYNNAERFAQGLSLRWSQNFVAPSYERFWSGVHTLLIFVLYHHYHCLSPCSCYNPFVVNPNQRSLVVAEVTDRDLVELTAIVELTWQSRVSNSGHFHFYHLLFWFGLRT